MEKKLIETQKSNAKYLVFFYNEATIPSIILQPSVLGQCHHDGNAQ